MKIDDNYKEEQKRYLMTVPTTYVELIHQIRVLREYNAKLATTCRSFADNENISQADKQVNEAIARLGSVQSQVLEQILQGVANLALESKSENFEDIIKALAVPIKGL